MLSRKAPKQGIHFDSIRTINAASVFVTLCLEPYRLIPSLLTTSVSQKNLVCVNTIFIDLAIVHVGAKRKVSLELPLHDIDVRSNGSVAHLAKDDLRHQTWPFSPIHVVCRAFELERR
jgi:hypothetical protein